jgi:hypothetical protein
LQLLYQLKWYLIIIVRCADSICKIKIFSFGGIIQIPNPNYSTTIILINFS